MIIVSGSYGEMEKAKTLHLLVIKEIPISFVSIIVPMKENLEVAVDDLKKRKEKL